MKRKEIKWRREGRGTMTGRQDGIIFRIFHPWGAPEQVHIVSCHDTRDTGRTISTAGHRTFTWEEAVEFCQKIAAGEIDLENMRAEFAAEDVKKERAGISYTTLLELEALRANLGSLGHNALLGFERGEGWPDGT